MIGSVTYSVLYQNLGDADATDTNLTVVLPSGMEYFDAIQNANTSPAVGSDGNITWNIGTVIADESGSYEIVAFPSATGSYTITTHIVSSDSADNLEPNNSDEVTTIFGGLKIEKSTSTPTVVQPINDGDTADVNYTITISNTLSKAIADVNVTDTLPAGFSYFTTTSVIGSTYLVDTSFFFSTSVDRYHCPCKRRSDYRICSSDNKCCRG